MSKVVVFQLEEEQYAIPIDYVVSIEKMSEPTGIPHMPEYVVGVVRIRGELVPVLDTARIFYRRPYVPTEKTRLVVVHTEQLTVAFIVDEAKEIIDLPEEAIKQVNLLAYRNAPYFTGVANLPERLITLLDPNRLFMSLEGAMDLKEQMEATK